MNPLLQLNSLLTSDEDSIPYREEFVEVLSKVMSREKAESIANIYIDILNNSDKLLTREILIRGRTWNAEDIKEIIPKLKNVGR